MTKHYFTYLALGDSYTIGEAVPLHESFPYRVVQLLRNKSLHIHAPEVVAGTGWTTLELAEHILHAKFSESYDFVTLLIGVNNQYRSLNSEDYKNDFEFLLKKALHFANDKNDHVIVLSIPDYSITPFAKEKDSKKIAEEIDILNNINAAIAKQNKVNYININESVREAVNDESLIAEDGLHPSGKEYAKWAEQIAEHIERMLNN
ncbi:MAG TPA: SGNH/GDSL hydrolase family protein [Chitinophagaceae bacterium]|jgi:lysophospholipase L1-like esterase